MTIDVSRISRHQMFMEMAVAASKRGTCMRRAVGAILVRHSDVLSVGYNGPPSGADHCYGNKCPLDRGACTRSAHAEYNVYWRAMERHVKVVDATLYCTSSPCESCVDLIIDAKLKRLFYQEEYRLVEHLDRLFEAGIPVYRMTPSGYVVNKLTGETFSAHEID